MANAQCAGIFQSNDVHVGTFGQARIALQALCERFETYRLGIGAKNHDVRIAEIHETRFGKTCNGERCDSRNPHLDANSIIGCARDNFGVDRTGSGVERQAFAGSGFIEPARRATNAVAAHLGFAAVGIDRAHSYVTVARAFEDEQPVGADSGAPVASPARESSEVA